MTIPNTGYHPFSIEGLGGIRVSQTGAHVQISDEGSAVNLAQSSWFIDPVSGNDQARGNTPASAIQTHEEFRRRIGNGFINIPMTVNLVGDFDETNPVRIWFNIGPNGTLTYKGTRTQLYSGSVTGVTTLDPATNQPWEITDAALPVSWTASDLINDASNGPRRIRGTSGDITDCVAWAVKDLGAKNARISPFIASSLFPVPVPAPGDTFVVESLSNVEDLTIDLRTSAILPPFILLEIEDIALAPNASRRHSARILTNYPEISLIRFYGCETGHMIFDGAGILVQLGCKASGDQNRVNSGATTGLFACAVFQNLVVNAGGTVNLDVDTLFQDCGLILEAGGIARISSCGVFDSPGEGVEMRVGSHVLNADLFLPHQLYGDGNADFGVFVNSLAAFGYAATKPVITGASGDASVGGAVVAWAAVPVTTAAELAAIRLIL